MNAARKNPALALAIVVEVLSTKLEEFSGTKDGKPYHIRKQEAYLHSGHGYPDRFAIMLGKSKGDDGEDVLQKPFKPGFYAVNVDSLRVERERLGFGWELSLTPLPDVVSVADLKAMA